MTGSGKKTGAALTLALPLAMCCVPQATQDGYEMASAESVAVVCTDEATIEKIRAVMLEALDEALKNHIVRTFEVWLKDDTRQPERAAVGVRNGVNAYVHARKVAITWSPVACPG